MATSRLDIDLSAVDHNLSVVQSVLAPENQRTGGKLKVGVCAVLKQDGYGVGALRLAKRLVGSGHGPGMSRSTGTGVDMIAVYTLDEARSIADAIPGAQILVLMPVAGIDRMDPVYRHVSTGRIHLTLHSLDQLSQLTETTTRIGASLPVHIQADTGLSRGGCLPDQARQLVERALATPRIKVSGLMTHFASPCCDADFTREQARLFRDFVESIKPTLKAAASAAGPDGPKIGGLAGAGELMLHAANSCALFRARSYHGSMVRVGQALLGYALDDAPLDEQFEFAADARKLIPAVRWTSTVAHIAEIPAGWPVGYGSTWRAPWRADGRKTRIALIPVGYADGYPRSLGGKGTGGPGCVAFTGRTWEKRSAGDPDEGILRAPREPSRPEQSPSMPPVYAPVVGRVSMDQITVDVTDVPEMYLHGVGLADGGPEVELMGRDRSAPNYISTLAAAGHSITHELLARVGPRVERVYRYPASAASAGAYAPVVTNQRGTDASGHHSGGATVIRVEPPRTAVSRREPGDQTGMAAYAG